MITGPVKRKKQIITQAFRKGRHYALDLRCVNFTNWISQPFVACEDAVILRIGRDKKDNGFMVLKPMETEYKEIKYIHINVDKCKHIVGDTVTGGEILGYSEVRGQSKSHHLHFEVWDSAGAEDPVVYFNRFGINYGKKT